MSSTTSSLSYLEHAITEEMGRGTFMDVYQVRITPEKIVFEDAFAGRKYRKKMVIQNFSNHVAYISIFSPTSLVRNYFSLFIFDNIGSESERKMKVNQTRFCSHLD